MEYVSISDDDLCATCRRCAYHPGDMSGCSEHFPGLFNRDGYVVECGEYLAVPMGWNVAGGATDQGEG